MATPEELFLTIQQFSEWQSVHRNTTKKWLLKGLPVRRIGRVVRIPVSEALKWLENQHRSSPVTLRIFGSEETGLHTSEAANIPECLSKVSPTRTFVRIPRKDRVPIRD